MVTKLLFCFGIILLIYPAFCFGTSIRGPVIVQENSEIERNVRAMLGSPMPLVLLWGNDFPTSLHKNKDCWVSTHGGPAPNSDFDRYLLAGSSENPPTKPGYRHRGPEHRMYIQVRQTWNVVLDVDISDGTPEGQRIKGQYTVLYADQTCFVLQLPKPQGKLECVAWVRADAVHFLHNRCKQAFATKCPACQSKSKEEAQVASRASD
uniref:Putative secreted peptide n=1 Tax=Rhipicephalus pulchellus TaxID=72859 RepID=L7MBW1_RHIPC